MSAQTCARLPGGCDLLLPRTVWAMHRHSCVRQRAVCVAGPLRGILGRQKYIAGDQLTEADIRLFMTLISFDHVYGPPPAPATRPGRITMHDFEQFCG